MCVCVCVCQEQVPFQLSGVPPEAELKQLNPAWTEPKPTAMNLPPCPERVPSPSNSSEAVLLRRSPRKRNSVQENSQSTKPNKRAPPRHKQGDPNGGGRQPYPATPQRTRPQSGESMRLRSSPCTEPLWSIEKKASTASNRTTTAVPRRRRALSFENKNANGKEQAEPYTFEEFMDDEAENTNNWDSFCRAVDSGEIYQ
jgi:hypothetical protein